MKKLFFPFIVLCLAFGLTSCRTEEQKKDRILVSKLDAMDYGDGIVLSGKTHCYLISRFENAHYENNEAVDLFDGEFNCFKSANHPEKFTLRGDFYYLVITIDSCAAYPTIIIEKPQDSIQGLFPKKKFENSMAEWAIDFVVQASALFETWPRTIFSFTFLFALSFIVWIIAKRYYHK